MAASNGQIICCVALELEFLQRMRLNVGHLDRKTPTSKLDGSHLHDHSERT